MFNLITGNKYHYSTRQGNWFEESEAEEFKMKNYLRKKEDNKVTTLKVSKTLNNGLQKCALTYSKDGHLRFGNSVMIQNVLNNCFLASDTSLNVVDNFDSFVVTGTQISDIMNRSVFKITKFQDEKSPYNDEIIRYGQKIHIEAHPKVYKKPLYLKAYPYSQANYAKLSKKMEIGITVKKDYSCVWTIEHPDIKHRFQAVGSPVETEQEILLLNCSLGHWLASDMKNKMQLNFNNIVINLGMNMKSTCILSTISSKTEI